MNRRLRAAGHTCRRQGCERPSRTTFCDACWSAVPGWLKASLAQARAAGDAALITGLMIKASDFAAQATASRPVTDGRTAYANAARLLGEHDEMVPAE